jgi:ADP-heptose:LPS heptosyltransferase
MGSTFYTRHPDPPAHTVGVRESVHPAILDEGREPVDEEAYARLSAADRERTPVRVQHFTRVRLSDDEVRLRRPPGVTDLVLHNGRSPGDVVVMSAVVRALHAAHPGRFRTFVECRFPDLWANNPDVTPEADLVQPKRIDWDWLHGEGSDAVRHLAHVWRDDLAKQLGVAIPLPDVRGAIYLTDAERRWPADLLGGGPRPFALVNSGTKSDMPAKGWGHDRYQAVVDHFRGRVEFVQVGASEDRHRRLSGAADLLGRTSIRDLIRLAYWSDLVVSGITFVTHLAAAVPTADGRVRPCVTIAGGLEPPSWVAYPGHAVLSAVGCLPCCQTFGCGRPFLDDAHHESRVCASIVPEGDGPVGRCMTLIPPRRAIDAIQAYIDGGAIPIPQLRTHELRRHV